LGNVQERRKWKAGCSHEHEHDQLLSLVSCSRYMACELVQAAYDNLAICDDLVMEVCSEAACHQVASPLCETVVRSGGGVGVGWG